MFQRSRKMGSRASSEAEEEIQSDPLPIFRPSKRQKVFRSIRQDFDQRGQTNPTPMLETLQDESTPTALAVRKSVNFRKLGITTSASTLSTPSGATRATDDSRDDGRKPRNQLGVGAIRFAPQTGLIHDDMEKHMNDYIESRITAAQQSQGAERTDSYNKSGNFDVKYAADTLKWGFDASKPTARQAAGLGKLQEIDLGPDAARLNMLRTQKAAARLNGETAIDDDATQINLKPKSAIKPRWGIAKPYRGRRRKRRTSDDVKRDQLVESLMSESRIEIYDNSTKPALGHDEEGDDVDERVAEEFKRNYLDNQLSKRRNPQPAKQPTAIDSDKKPKGPKLGGSRSARAAMYKAMQDTSAQRK